METNEKLSSAIFNMGRLIKQNICNSNCWTDFTQIEVEVLKFVEKNKNVKMKSIAEYLHIKPASATPVIESLAKKGSIKRTKNNKDRRTIYIALTAKGEKTLKEKHKSIRKTIGKVFKKLSEKDKNNLIKILEKTHAENI